MSNDNTHGFNIFEPEDVEKIAETSSVPQIKWKRLHPEAKPPHKGEPSDLGYDISVVPDEEWFACGAEGNEFYLEPGASHIFSTGISVATEPSWGFLLRDRSGMGAVKKVHVLAGVIEGTYRGEWKVALINLGDEGVVIRSGDRIVQAILTPIYNGDVEEVDELPPSDRGEKGFGSSGR